MDKAVLGVDAAERDGRWQLLAVAPSYDCFMTPTSETPAAGVKGSLSDPARLLQTAHARCERPIDLIAVDMPLSHEPITGRRTSDNAVSQAYGAKSCGTHSPTSVRPGAIADRLKQAFGEVGYPLATEHLHARSLIEVYPHPALVELARTEKRLPYKVQNTARYWPRHDAMQRRAALFEIWETIVALLDARIAGTRLALGTPNTQDKTRDLKAWEDMLDAIVCAWVGIAALNGQAVPHGDAVSAIWIPRREA